jgi:hypothetical protein
MRALVLAAAVVGATTLVGFGGASTGLTDLRVCGSGSFDKAMGRCAANSTKGLRTSTLYCSVKTTQHTGDQFTGTFRYKGRAFPTQRGKVSGDGWIYTYLTIGGGSFPAGPWTCTVTAGKDRAQLGFTSAGAAGAVSGLAACLTSRTVLAGSVRACKQDDGKRALPATSGVTCSAVYALASGKTAKAEVLYDGEPTGLEVVKQVPLPVSVFGVQVSKPGGLPAGDYSCVFSLDGKRVATKRFSVGG